MNPNRGVTFVELVVVLVMIGILAAFAIPRFIDRSEFELPGFQQELAAGLRYAQKYAYSAGCPVRAVIAAGGFELRHSSSCAAGDFSVPLQHPTEGTYIVSAPSGISLSPTGSFEFLPTGEANATLIITLNSSAGSRQVAVVGPTGYVDTGS